MQSITNSRRRTGFWLAAASVLVLAVSAGISAAASRTAPTNVSPPTIVGKAQEGQSLTANAGTWKGTPPITYKGQWLRCDVGGGGCTEIAGANQPTYKLTGDDVDHTIRVAVTATNNDGSATARSARTGTVQPAPANAPANTAAPTVSGSAVEGQTLTGDPGDWDGTKPITFAYQWQSCDKNGLICSNISGAMGKTYALVSNDVDNTIRLRVTASNSAGNTVAFSRTTAVVQGKNNPPPSGGGPAGAIKLPNGQTSIPVTSVSSPERLVIVQAVFSPNPLRSRSQPITAKFKIQDTRGYVVRNALVFAIPLPYGWTTQPPEVQSETDGWATVTMRATSNLPRRGAIVMFVRARRAGDSILTGISSRRLVQMLVSLG